MVSVTDARARARKLVERDARAWAASGGDSARLEIVLHPPTERAALADLNAAMEWTASWRAAADPSVTVIWGTRTWPSAGTQTVPERCVVEGADDIAAFAGAAVNSSWELLRDRAGLMRTAFDAGTVAALEHSDPLGDAIRSQARSIEALPEGDFATLLHVVAWLVENPASGWRIRQLPIRGIDTKWMERHRSLVEALHSAVSGREALGLIEKPVLVRVRFLDPRLRPGGLTDITAPVGELAELSVSATAVVVVENLETLLALPELDGVVVVHGSGYAVGRLAAIPWLRTSRVVYWGDLDSDGFAILHALRASGVTATSILMDEQTLLDFRDLWATEARPTAGTYPTLTASEEAALARIRIEGNVRLEQERIPWEVALDAVHTAVGCLSI